MPIDHRDLEHRRLAALRELDILDSEPEPGFDALTRLVASLYGTSIAVISLIDTERQWFKAGLGLDACETSRDVAFCDYTIRQDDLLLVLDASKDARFCDNPMVTGGPCIRFYAGVPIRFDGYRVGTICVSDPTPRSEFSDEDRRRLLDFAETVTSMMALRKDAQVKKRSIRSLNETQAKLEMMEAVAGVGYWYADIATRQVRWSSGIYNILGLDPETYVPSADGIATRYHPEDWQRVSALFERALAEGEPFSCEARVNRADGIERWVRSEGTVERDEDGRPVALFGIFLDITDQKAVEDVLTDARKAAEAYAQAQSDFLSNMSHEIRTPLTAIIGYADLLGDRGDLPEDAQSWVARVRRGGKTLLSLVNDVLDCARLESGQLELHIEPTDTRALVIDAGEQFRAVAQAKNLSLRLDIDKSCPPTLWIDDTRVTQVLNNLVGNACKFTEAGEVCIRAFGIRDGVRIEVRDTGPGVAPENLGKLFQRFTQADSSVHGRHGGSGLGLSICSDLITLMGGRIGVESTEGRGSCFWFELPVQAAEAHAA